MIRKEVTKMDIGVSTACLYPLETEKALYELAKREVKNVEIFINSVDELEGQVLVELRRTIGEYGISVKSMHPFSSPMETLFLFGDYPRRTEYLIDIYKRYFEVMEELGAKVFVLHGAILSSKVPDGRYMERYLRLYRIAKQFGVTVAQENICYCKSSSVKFISTANRKRSHAPISVNSATTASMWSTKPRIAYIRKIAALKTTSLSASRRGFFPIFSIFHLIIG